MTPRTVRIDGFAMPADGSDDGTLIDAGSMPHDRAARQDRHVYPDTAAGLCTTPMSDVDNGVHEVLPALVTALGGVAVS
jgi:hypothetical protein